MRPPYSAAAERNRSPILEVVLREIAAGSRVLEIGSGTGQHAGWIATRRPDLHWQTSDTPALLPVLETGLAAYATVALPPPIPLDVLAGPWPIGRYEAVFSANTAHILSWRGVCAMLEGAARALVPDGRVLLYGPFSRRGAHTSEGNSRFDRELRGRGAGMGIRALESVCAEAARHGMTRVAEYAMPANNLMLVWRL